MHWWDWSRASEALHQWVRALIGPERAYTITFRPGGGSYVSVAAKELVVDPTMVNAWGGADLLPLRWRMWRLTTLPQLQWHAARALARHESAHILFTESWPTRGPTHANLMNALEDGRIERLLGRSYPWCWADFLPLGRLVCRHVVRSVPREARGAQAILPMCLIHRWDVLRPRGAPSTIRFTDPADQATWERDIQPLVEESWLAPNCARVGAIAAEILHRLDLPEHDTTHAGLIMAAPDAAEILPSGVSRGADDAPLVLTTMATEPAQGGDGPDMAVDASEPPAIDADPAEGQLWAQPYRAIEQEVIGAARRLARQLTPPTPNIEERASEAFGRFSARHYVRTQGELPLLKRRDDAPDSSGLAVVVLIDRTASMGNRPGEEGDDGPGHPDSFHHPAQRMYHARRAVLLIERACALAGVPLAIGYAGNDVRPSRIGVDRLFLRSPVVWLKTFATPAHAEGPRALIAGMYGDSYQECVSAALRIAQAALEARPEPSRLIVYLHDGIPTDEAPEQVARTAAAMRQAHLHVVGVYVGEQSGLTSLEAIFTPEHTVGVAELAKLPERLGSLIRRYWSSR